MSWDAVLESAREVVAWVLSATSVPVLLYFFLINTSYLVIIVLAALEVRSQAEWPVVTLEAPGPGRGIGGTAVSNPSDPAGAASHRRLSQPVLGHCRHQPLAGWTRLSGPDRPAPSAPRVSG